MRKLISYVYYRMDIVVPTYIGHLEYIRKFYDTFNLNCLDKNEVTINLIISEKDKEMFEKTISMYPNIKTKIVIFSALLEKYVGEKINEDFLLSEIGKFNYQSLKKLFGALETNNEYVCLFD